MNLFMKIAAMAVVSGGMLTLPARAGITLDIATANPGATTATVKQYVDWTAKTSTTGHSNWSTFTPPGKTAAVKYLTVTGAANSDVAGCYELYTSKFGTTSADTQIWLKDNSGAWISLNDDFGGTNYSHVMVQWLNGANTRGSTQQRIRVAAFSSTFNMDQFYLNTKFVSNDPADCTFNSMGYPVATFNTDGTVGTVFP
jgi:hypothetical protein